MAEKLPEVNTVADGVPLREDDNLRVTFISDQSNDTVIVHLRILAEDGRIIESRHSFFHDTFSIKDVFFADLASGTLISASASVDSIAIAGTAYISLQLQKGSLADAVPYRTLASGYMSPSGLFSWPGSRIQSALDGPGFVNIQVPAVPAAGANYVFDVNDPQSHNIVGLSFVMVADANAAARSIFIQFGESSSLTLISTQQQNADETKTYHIYNFGAPTYQVANNIYMSLPPNLWTFKKEEITVGAFSIQVGDQFSAMRFSTRAHWDNI